MPDALDLHGLLSRTINLDEVLPAAHDQEPDSTVTLVRLDSSWRITDRQAFESLGWEPATRLLIRATRARALVVRHGTRARAGEMRLHLDARGRLRIPRDHRQALHLRTGEELLVATHEEELLLAPARVLLAPLLAQLG